jgi:hypothetical protein
VPSGKKFFSTFLKSIFLFLLHFRNTSKTFLKDMEEKTAGNLAEFTMSLFFSLLKQNKAAVGVISKSHRAKIHEF